MTQCERVLKYMHDFGSITHLQAVADLGVQRLAARVSDLKAAGYQINSRWVKGKNRYGEPTRFVEYSLEEKQC